MFDSKIARNALFPVFLLTLLCTSKAHTQTKSSFLQKIKDASEFYGFTDIRSNLNLDSKSPQPNNYTYSEYKLQLESAHYFGLSETRFKGDFMYDIYLKRFRFDLREANIWLPTWSWLDLKIGRQILTWGKGDLLFINDLFPKDWQSFFIGREIEYLKAPSDALKLNINTKAVQINFVYTPQFDPDRYLTGERVSLIVQGQPNAFTKDNTLPVTLPNQFFRNAEYAIRFQKTIGKLDLALYGYHGYWKSPSAYNLDKMAFDFPSLTTYGLSIETNLLKGIVAAEMGHYISGDDQSGDNPLIRNSDFRYLISYNRDFKKDWNIGLQFYSEITLKYQELIRAIPLVSSLPAKTLNQFSIRVGKMLLKQKLNLSLISFYSFSGKDSYIRPNFSYKFTDKIKCDIGGNIFLSKNPSTFWGQFDRNDNIYLGFKYNI